MPAGIGRPYNKDERIIGEAKKRNAPGEGYRAVSRDTDNQVARNMTRGGLSPDERSKYAK